MRAPAEPGRTRALQYRFTGYLRDPQHAPPLPGIEQRRLDLYAELVFNNVEELLAANFPVIRSLHEDAAWNALVRGFLAEHRASTPLFLEIGREFQRYLQARQERGAGDAPCLLELAHYEWAELALSIDESELSAVPHDPHGDPLHGVPVVSPLAWCFGYRFPVHTIRPDFRPDEAPEQPTLLLLVRDRRDGVSFIEINPLTALLLERLQDNRTQSGLECLRTLLAETGNADDAALLDGGAAVLRELQQREALLGTAI
jgi:hypothetical protein